MVGANVSALATTWNQTSSDPSEELVLVAQGVAPSPDYNTSVTYLSTAIADQASGPSVSATQGAVSNTVFTTDKDSLWLTFDTTIAGAPTDTFHLFIDGRLRATFAPPTEGTGSSGSFLILYDIGPGTHTLSLVAEGPINGSAASPSASASLTNLRISSTTDIQRNLTPTQTKELIGWVVALIILVIVVLLALLLFLIIWIVKKMRRNSSSHEERIRDAG
jgi:hypothetical protein